MVVLSSMSILGGLLSCDNRWTITALAKPAPIKISGQWFCSAFVIVGTSFNLQGHVLSFFYCDEKSLLSLERNSVFRTDGADKCNINEPSKESVKKIVRGGTQPRGISPPLTGPSTLIRTLTIYDGSGFSVYIDSEKHVSCARQAAWAARIITQHPPLPQPARINGPKNVDAASR
jgi:hypothetical protein